MKIKSFRFIKKDLQLNNKIHLDGTTVNSRELIQIKIETENNLSGIGETVILQSHGTESKEKLYSKLEYLSHNIFNFSLENNFFNNEPFLNELKETPGLRTAIEQAIFNILLQIKNPKIEDIINTEVQDSIKLNALIPSLPKDETYKLIDQKIIEGFNVFKIKLGHRLIEDDLKLIKEISKSFPNINLRLDPNCKWTYDAIIKHANVLSELNVDYIEQPCLNSEDLIKIQLATSIKIAADESARDLDSIKHLIKNGIKVIILKPMTVGGILNSLEIINYAKEKNVEMIITSSFESNVGLQVPILLASTLDTENYHGLNTADFFKTNINSINWPIKAGIMNSSNIKIPIKDFYD